MAGDVAVQFSVGRAHAPLCRTYKGEGPQGHATCKGGMAHAQRRAAWGCLCYANPGRQAYCLLHLAEKGKRRSEFQIQGEKGELKC